MSATARISTAGSFRILLISGSLRAGSTNTALLRTAEVVAAEVVAAEPLSAVLFDGLGRLPHFNPDDDRDPLHPAVADLRSTIARADALLFSSPEYAGGLPGTFKNLLDWTVGGGETYGMPVAWVNVSTAPTGAGEAQDSLRKVLGRTGADIVEAACVHIPVPRSAVGEDGLVSDPAVRGRLSSALATIATHVHR